MDATKEQVELEMRGEAPSPIAAATNGAAAKMGTMRAIVYTEYGQPEGVLQLREVDRPVPKAGEVLLRVRASSVGPWDWLSLVGQPYLMRPMFGFPKPNRNIPGADVAGTVKAVGDGVATFESGDEVYGELSNGGGYAEYVCIPEQHLSVKPVNLTFEQAASMPIAGLTALQGLPDQGKVRPDQQVLINGASGSVGTFAVQIAKALGAEVTAVCSTRNVELVRSLGADQVIDYTVEDFTKGTRRYDVVMDNVGNRSLSEIRRALKSDGIYVPSFGRLDRKWVGPLPQLIETVLRSPFMSQKVVMWVQTTTSQELDELTKLAESGAVTPVIEREIPLMDAAQALRFQGDGHAQGKTVVTVP